MEKKAILVDVLGDGACFYHAVYGSLKAQNLLERVVHGFITEDNFIRQIKKSIRKDPEYKIKYHSLFHKICEAIQSSDDDFLKEIIAYLPDSLLKLLIKHIKNEQHERKHEQINRKKTQETRALAVIREKGKDVDRKIKAYIKANPINEYSDLHNFRTRHYKQSQRRQACSKFDVFFDNVYTEMMKNSYWATQVETDSVKEFLQRYDITMNIYTHRDHKNVEIIKVWNPKSRVYNIQTIYLNVLETLNTIYLYNDGGHYQYFDFSLKAKQAAPKKPHWMPNDKFSMPMNYSTKVKYTMKPGKPAIRQFDPYKKPATGKKNQVKQRKPPKPIYISSSDSDDDVIYVSSSDSDSDDDVI